MPTERLYSKAVAAGALALTLATGSAGAAVVGHAPFVQAVRPNATSPLHAGRRNASGAVSTFTVLHSFTGGDGANPAGELLEDQHKNIFGITSAGGATGNGTIFEYTAAGTLTTLHTFKGADGSNPQGGLLNFYGNINFGGTIYGCTQSGGAYNNGTVFSLSTSGVLKTLHSFTGGSDGSAPAGTLFFFTDGNIYGTTSTGGAQKFGTVFKLSTNGAFSTIHAFAGSDGGNPLAGLSGSANGRTINGAMFGTTSSGGANNAGTIFAITPQGGFKNLRSLASATDGSAPLAELIPDDSGNLYGTASAGGSGSGGTVFEISSTGSFRLLYAFPMNAATPQYPNGTTPLARLAGYSAGALYGTAAFGGPGGGGVAFKFSNGAFATLHAFSGPDGQFPAGQLLVSPDGNIYGTTVDGGSSIDGVLFALPVQ